MEYKKFEDFKFWFVYKSQTTYQVLDKESGNCIGYVKDGTVGATDPATTPVSVEYDALMEWEQFMQRPEYCVGQIVKVNGSSAQDAKCYYEKLLSGLIMCRAYKNGKDPDNYTDYISNVLNWVRQTDFYKAPASTVYHGSFPHGLLYHTLTVYNCMVELYQIPKFLGKVDIDSATLCCLVHDWCKIGLYEQYKKNVKNEQTGQWERVDAYKRAAFPHTFGHGVSSMCIAMKLFKLTESEALGIRWHMGKWNVSENEVNELQQANEQFPMVHLIQFADQLAITEY